jgi:uncharacterized protein
MEKDKKVMFSEPLRISWSYQQGQKNEGLPWGPHKVPVFLDLKELSLSLEKDNDGYRYRRDGLGASVEKFMSAQESALLLSPVEPLHLPTAISTLLMIELEHPLIIEPRSNLTIFVTYPLEIAVIIAPSRADEYIVDLFTFNRTKFTLYGNVRDGKVCKYWKSAFYSEKPSVNPLQHGVMRLDVQNPGNKWAEIHKAVFSAYGMKMVYGPDLVLLSGQLKIINELSAETTFNDPPLPSGMKKAFEQFNLKLLSQQGKTLMEEGY